MNSREAHKIWIERLLQLIRCSSSARSADRLQVEHHRPNASSTKKKDP
jgi:hypothetical protein